MKKNAFIFTLLFLELIFTIPAGASITDNFDGYIGTGYAPEPATVGLLILGSVFFIIRKRS